MSFFNLIVRMLVRFLFLVLFVQQTSTADAYSCNNNKLKRYYYYQNKAELEIINKNYIRAIKYYKKAERIEKRLLFPQDFLNLGLCELLSNKSNSGLNRHFEELLVYGMPKEYLKQKLELSILLFKDRNQRIIDELEELLNFQVHLKLDSSLYIKLDSIAKKDQSLRFNKNYNNREAPDSILDNQIRNIDVSNAKAIKSLLDTLIYPTFIQIGLWYYNARTNPISIIFYHNINGAPNASVNFTKHFENAFSKGFLNKTEAMYWIDLMNGRNDFGVMDCGLVKFYWEGDTLFKTMSKQDVINTYKFGFINFDSKSIKEINKNRKKFYAESVVDYRKKLLFSMENKLFDLDNNVSGKSIYGLIDLQEYKSAVSSMTFH